jgi:hypothetical protein
MKIVAANTAIILLIVALSLFAYERLVRIPAMRIGVVDLADTYREKEAQFVANVTKASNPNDPNLALEFAGKFTQDLSQALEAFPAECRCLVLVKAAVVGRPENLIDLTPDLRLKVGLPPQPNREQRP